MVAQYADASNVFGDVERIKHLMSVIDGHCETVGRDPSEITRTKLATLVIADTHEEAAAAAEPLRDADGRALRRRWSCSATPTAIGEQLAAHREAGLDGVIVNMPQVGDLEKVELAGKTLARRWRERTAATSRGPRIAPGGHARHRPRQLGDRAAARRRDRRPAAARLHDARAPPPRLPAVAALRRAADARRDAAARRERAGHPARRARHRQRLRVAAARPARPRRPG